MRTHTEENGLTAQTEERGLLSRMGEKTRALLASYAGREALPGVVLLLIGVLFARTPLLFGAYPLGLALLCSTRKHLFPVMLGLIGGAATLGMPGIVYIGIYGIALLLRLLWSWPQLHVRAVPTSARFFGELPQLQVTTAVLCSLLAFGYEWFVSGLVTSTLLFGLGMVGGAGFLTLGLTGLFSYGLTWEDVMGKRGVRPVRRSRGERVAMEIGVCLLLGLAVYGVQAYALFGLSFGYLLASFVTLFVARRFGALRGCVVGLLISLGTNPLYAPAFGLMGLLAGGLWPLGAIYSICIGTVGGVAWVSVVGGLTGFLEVAPELFISALLAMPLLPKLYSDAIAGEVRDDRASAEEAVRRAIASTEEEDRLTQLSRAFRTLAGVFGERSYAPSLSESFAMCDRIFTSHCVGCPRRASCWDAGECLGMSALKILAEQSQGGAVISGEGLPVEILTDCPQIESILRGIKVENATLWQASRRRASAVYPAQDYHFLSELLGELSKAKKQEEGEDPVTAGAIRRVLAERGLRPAVVSVRGKREKRIVVGCGEMGNKQRVAAAAIAALEEQCGCKLSVPSFDTSGEVTTMETHTTPQFCLEVAYASKPANNSLQCGDSVGVFESPDGYSYLLLSDGMGTGEAAARAADTCAVFLSKMLSAGNPEETSLKMLNHLLGVREGEISATVDLFRFDTYYGRACFLKSGAAASYVRRDGNLFRLRSKTIPIGLVEDLDAEKLRFDTHPGDIIIMLSDGISQTSEDAPWLMELLSRPLNPSLKLAANSILEAAAKHAAARDDMTVILARVVEVGSESSRAS